MNESLQQQNFNGSETNSEEASEAQADTGLARSASSSTFLGAGLDIGLSGAGARKASIFAMV